MLIGFLSTLGSSSWANQVYRVVSALKHYLARLNLRWPDAPYLRLLIAGIAKSAPPPKHLSRDPLLPHHLHSIYCRHAPEAHSFNFLRPFAILVLALRFGLRPAEVAAM